MDSTTKSFKFNFAIFVIKDFKTMNLPKRKPTRLKGYDYSKPEAYFITICVKGKKQLLVEIVGCGEIAAPHNNEISKFVSLLKRYCNREYGINIWQTSCNDYIIRGMKDYQKIWEYIDTNIYKWKNDCFYTSQKE